MTLFDVLLDLEAPTSPKPTRVRTMVDDEADYQSPGILHGRLHPPGDESAKYQRCGGGRRVIRKPLGNN